MKTDPDPGALERLFHEPNRMAILSALCAAREEVPFTDLRALTGLTDGNLSRHLKALEDEGVVRLRKFFAGVKPRTTVALTEQGLKRFQDYLAALEQVLRKARQAVEADRRTARPVPMIGKKRPA